MGDVVNIRSDDEDEQDVDKLAAEIREGLTEIKSALARREQAEKDAVKWALYVGERLLLAKEQVPHGAWILWLQANEIDDRTARRYMQVTLYAKTVAATDFGDMGLMEIAAEAGKAKKQINSIQELESKIKRLERTKGNKEEAIEELQEKVDELKEEISKTPQQRKKDKMAADKKRRERDDETERKILPHVIGGFGSKIASAASDISISITKIESADEELIEPILKAIDNSIERLQKLRSDVEAVGSDLDDELRKLQEEDNE